jgi:hypothetical protein
MRQRDEALLQALQKREAETLARLERFATEKDLKQAEP